MSQAEAMRWKRRALAAEGCLEQERNRWTKNWAPGWVRLLDPLQVDERTFVAVTVARALGHAVVCVPSGSYREVVLYSDHLVKR